MSRVYEKIPFLEFSLILIPKLEDYRGGRTVCRKGQLGLRQISSIRSAGAELYGTKSEYEMKKEFCSTTYVPLVKIEQKSEPQAKLKFYTCGSFYFLSCC